MNILIINGSPRPQGNTRKLTHKIAAALRNENVEVSLFDLSVNHLPLFDGSVETEEKSEVKHLQSLAEQADGFFICTPEYHSAISGALKNALDFLSRTYFTGKPVAIAAAAGGGKGGINALNNLRVITRGLGGLTLSPQCVIDPDDFNEQGDLQEHVLPRLQMIIDDLLHYTHLLHSKQNETISV